MNWRPTDSRRPVEFKETSDYVRLGVYVTGIPDAEYPWHLDDVKAIRRLYDPGFIPIFRRIAYRTPSGAVVSFPHHGIGRYVENREPDTRLDGCLMPYGVPWRKPNVVDFWLEPAQQSKFAARHGLPAGFQPWGDWIVRMAEEARTLDAKEMKAALKRNQAGSETLKALRAEEEEAVYRAKAEAQTMKNTLDSLTSSDFRELDARAKGWAPELETKPFIHLAH